MELDLSQISYDQKFYPRVNGTANWMTVLRYKEALERPSYQFPPVVVVRSTGYQVPYILIDGLHRLKAYANAGRRKIPAIVERIPQSKWMIRSVELNRSHGRQLDNRDKAWIALRLKDDGVEMPKIAELLNMKEESLERIVTTRAVRISSAMAETIPEGPSNRRINGRRYGFLKAPVVDVSDEESTVAALQTQHSITSHDVVAILDSMISILRSKVVDVSDEEVAAKVQVVKDLLASI